MVALFPRRPARRPASYDAARSLGVLHIPKTAGSSLIEAIVRALQPSTAVSGFDRALFGGFTAFATLSPSLQSAIHHNPAQIPPAHLLAGHMALSTLRQADPSRQVITVLREPIARLLSHWLFWRGHTDEQLASWGAWADQVRLSRLPLEAFLAAPTLACQHDNLCLRMLLWPHPHIPAAAFIDPSHDRLLLAQAKHALRHLPFADLVENPALTANLSAFLTHALIIPRSNQTARLPEALRRPLQDELTSDALAALSRLTRLDAELWRVVQQARMPATDHATFRNGVLMRNIARFAGLMQSKQGLLS